MQQLKETLIQYLIYVSLFIGTGFLSGSIVHFPLNPMRFGVIGAVGAMLFVAVSTLNEKLYNKRNFAEEGVAKIIFFSLVLSLGIGMISGGVQHFDEFPQYASYLIPFGIVVSLAGYLLKSNISLHWSQLGKMVGSVAVFVVVLGYGLHAYAHALVGDTAGRHEVVENALEPSAEEHH